MPKEIMTHLPTPLAALSPLLLPDDPLDLAGDPDDPACPAPIAQSSEPADPRGEPMPGRGVLLACWKTPTERGRLFKDWNQLSISPVGSSPAVTILMALVLQ